MGECKYRGQTYGIYFKNYKLAKKIFQIKKNIVISKKDNEIFFFHKINYPSINASEKLEILIIKSTQDPIINASLSPNNITPHIY